MFTETWYKDDSDFFLLPSYRHFFQNRDYSCGGGVSMLVSNHSFGNVPQFSSVTKDYEALCIRKDSTFLSVTYRPPNGNVPCFLGFILF